MKTLPGDIRIGFIGGGNMGEAIIKGLLSAKLMEPQSIAVFDVSRSRMETLRERYGVSVQPHISALAAQCAVILLAVKPQNIADVLNELRPGIAPTTLILSIAAGVSLESLTQALGPEIPVVRIMPNTPALVQQGASALSRGKAVTDEQMAVAKALFGAVGIAIEVEEKWMDAVTGLSGSGPAYFLLLLESLMDAGVLMGLPRPVARDLVLQTALGTVLMARDSGKHPAELKDMITSPGGTTIEGLAVMEDAGVRGTLMRAVEAATLRSGQLGMKPK